VKKIFTVSLVLLLSLPFFMGAAQPTASQEMLLAKFIMAEAGDQSYEVQLAVGAVVLNRVKDDRFPNTLAGVIFQEGAFKSVVAGSMNIKPDESAVKAAKQVLGGQDPTEGCLYYYNPKTETDKFLLEREAKNSFGRFRFAI